MQQRNYIVLVAGFLLWLSPELLFAQAMASSGTSDVKHARPSKKELAREVTDPGGIQSEIAVQNIFIASTHEADGYANQLIVEPTLAFPVENFPDQVLRLTMPVLVTSPDGSNGLGDLEILEVSILPGSGRWGQWGLGPAFVFPTATNRQSGQGKWQVGGTAVVVVDSIRNFQIGLLTHNLTSFAGDNTRSDVATLFLEPIFIYYLVENWYVGWGDMTIEFDWKNGGAATVPLNVQVGRLFDVGPFTIDVALEPFWVPIHEGATPEWGIQFSLIFPLSDLY